MNVLLVKRITELEATNQAQSEYAAKLRQTAAQDAETIDHLKASLVTVRSERDFFQEDATKKREANKRMTRTLAEISGAADARLERDGKA